MKTLPDKREGLNLRHLDAFRLVAQTGSVTEAGRLLNVSQPGISRSIAELERNLGFALFERRRKRLHITHEGALFLDELERATLGLERLERSALEIRNLQRGHLRVAAIPALSMSLMPGAIAGFLAAWPDIKVSAAVYPSQEVVDSVAAQQLDVGVAQMRAENADVRVVASFGADCVCAMPVDHRLCGLAAVGPADLEGESLITLPLDTPAGRGIDQAFAAVGTRALPRIETFISITACALVVAGAGVALIDPFTADFFGPRRLATRPFRPGVPFDFKVIVPVSRKPSEAAQRFVAHLCDFLGRQPLLEPDQARRG